MVESLGLQQGESTLFGESGVHYEGSGITVEWHSQSVGDERFTPITVNCDSNSSVSMKGIYCGRQYKEVESSLLQSGYRSLEGEGEQQIFMDNVAVFEDRDSTTAVFRGQQYILTFDCSESWAIQLSGFDEATVLGDTFRQ